MHWWTCNETPSEVFDSFLNFHLSVIWVHHWMIGCDVVHPHLLLSPQWTMANCCCVILTHTKFDVTSWTTMTTLLRCSIFIFLKTLNCIQLSFHVKEPCDHFAPFFSSNFVQTKWWFDIHRVNHSVVAPLSPCAASSLRAISRCHQAAPCACTDSRMCWKQKLWQDCMHAFVNYAVAMLWWRRQQEMWQKCFLSSSAKWSMFDKLIFCTFSCHSSFNWSLTCLNVCKNNSHKIDCFHQQAFCDQKDLQQNWPTAILLFPVILLSSINLDSCAFASALTCSMHQQTQDCCDFFFLFHAAALVHFLF